MKHLLKNLVSYLKNCYHYIHAYRYESTALAAKKYLWKNINLTAEQQEEFQSVYGNKISNKWHRLYQSYTGKFNKDYFPEILFSTRLEPMFCPSNICKVLQDKSLVEILYASVVNLKFPKTVIINCSGIFYDGNRNIINRDMAITFVEHWNKSADFIIKPTVNTKEGKDVLKIKKNGDFNKERIAELFDIYRKNYIVQECIVNCEEIQQLYDKSLNTFRVMTYILEDRLYHTPLILRIGRYGSEIDDELSIGVSDDGYLRKEAYTFAGERYSDHPDTKVRFTGYYIPGVAKIIESAYACHKKTPHTKFVSWDFAIDKNCNPVLIEANLLGHSSWFPQVVCGESTFGDNTKRILELIGIR